MVVLRVILLSVLLAACTQTEYSGFRFGLASAPITLDPRFATDAASTRINRLLYQRLVEFDESMQPTPSMATWQRLTNQHYRFFLTQETAFHNQKIVDMHDVKATYASVLDPQVGSPHRASLNMIESMDVIDEKTLDFHLNRADLMFPGRLVIGILPKKQLAAEHLFNRQPIGSGPFQFKSWPESGKLVLERLHDRTEFEFLKVKDPTVRVLKLMRRELDMIQNDLQPELITHLLEKQKLHVLTMGGTRFSYLGFNMEDDIVGQETVRKAIAYALDRDTIIKYVFGGAATKANAILKPDHWAGAREIPGYIYDPVKARRFMQEAGYSLTNRPTVVYKTSSDPFRIRLATIVQQQLAEVGIDVILKTYDWGTFYGDIKAGRFQMFSLSWVGIKNPDIFHYVFHSESIPPAGANRGRFHDQQADLLINLADKANTQEAQAQHYVALQHYLWEHLPYVPLWYEDNVFISQPDIKGYTLAQDGNYDGLAQVYRQLNQE